MCQLISNQCLSSSNGMFTKASKTINGLFHLSIWNNMLVKHPYQLYLQIVLQSNNSSLYERECSRKMIDSFIWQHHWLRIALCFDFYFQSVFL